MVLISDVQVDLMLGFRIGKSKKLAQQGKIPLYRLPGLLRSTNGEYIFVVEGEKDADRLCDEGLVATTSGSAQSWQHRYDKLFSNRKVCILPDNDIAGRDYAKTVSKSLRRIGAKVRVIRLRQHLLNAQAKESPRGWRLVKKRQSRKIDLAIALAIACQAAQANFLLRSTSPGKVCVGSSSRFAFDDYGITERTAKNMNKGLIHII